MSTGIGGMTYYGEIKITDEFLDKFMESGELIEVRSTLLLTIDVNMGNWSPQKLVFYKKFIASVTVENMIKVRGTIFDDCVPIPVELLPTISPVKYTEINLGMFRQFEMDTSPTSITDNELIIIKTGDARFAEIAHLLNAPSIELMQKKQFSKGLALLKTMQEAFGSVKIQLKHERNHEIQLMPDELIITN